MRRKRIWVMTFALLGIVVCSVVLVGSVMNKSTEVSDSKMVQTEVDISTVEDNTKEESTEIFVEETTESYEFLNLTKNYLILIEKESQRESIEAFKTFKESKGFSVFVKVAEQDLIHTDGEDRSTELEIFLDQLDKELSLDYVLFIGDPYDKDKANPQNTGGIIPMRYLYFNDDYHKTHYSFEWYDYVNPRDSAFNTPSDFTYALKLAWDYDKDGYAGELREMKRALSKESIQLKFLLGRIPFSDNQTISQILNHTIAYETTRKSESNGLIAAGILGYPESLEFNYVQDCAYYGDELSKNMLALQIENTTMFEQSGLMPSAYESILPINMENFRSEIEKGYDMIYTLGHNGSVMDFWDNDANNNKICDDEAMSYDIFDTDLNGLSTGFLYLDGCHTLSIEKDTDIPSVRHFQDFMINGFTSAGIATTRESGFNASEYADRIVSNMFVNQSNLYAYEFYQSIRTLTTNYDLMEAYIYCYLGDPSLEIYP